ncbi:MAG TPA: ABC transporter permease [Blastocatellia bacterium]|nr:ABC transporter permease [Blastocatellia bacterium]
MDTSLTKVNHAGGKMFAISQDVRFAIRGLRKNPNFTAVAVIALALGIGANTAIFSVVNAVLLRPLPYKEPARLVALGSTNLQTGERYGVSPADYWDWQEQTQAFEHLTTYTFGGFSFKDAEHPEMIPGARVSTSFFETLGVQPMLGRTFVTEEGYLNGPPAVVLSHRLWQRRFGADPRVVGKTINNGETATTVIGVMPPDFKFPTYAELWTPLARDSGEMKYRAARYMQVIGRLRSGQTIGTAEAEMKTVARRLEAQYPKDNKGVTAQLMSLRDHLVRETRTALLILLGAVGFVLLIACANVANLLMARAAARRKEMAIRLALGAGRWQLIRQLLVESVVLALAGAGVGLVFASWGVDALMGLVPEHSSYRFPGAVRIDAVVLGFTLLVAVLTGILFGLIPGWQASRPTVNEWLKEGGRGGEGWRHERARGVLVVAEIALALVLLVGAGLLANSFVRMQRVDQGYDPRGLLAMWVAAPDKFRDTESKAAFYRQMIEEVSRVPGVESVSVTTSVPFGALGFPFNIEGRPLPDDAGARYSAVGTEYFRVLKTPLRAGREFNDRDKAGAAPVAIINETMARQYFAGEDPLGKKISLNFLGRRVVREVVGVVADIRQDEPGAPIRPEVFAPYEQAPWFSHALVIRSAGADPLGVKNDVQRAIWAVDKDQPASKTVVIAQELSELIAEPRLYTILLGTFALAAFALAGVGIYGVMAYSVAQRTHEIGIRMALGARAGDVLRLVVGQGMKLAVIGVVIGLAASFALTRLMKGLLYGVSAHDPLTFAVIALLLTVVALVACFVPARRATKVDPMIALRYE